MPYILFRICRLDLYCPISVTVVGVQCWCTVLVDLQAILMLDFLEQISYVSY